MTTLRQKGAIFAAFLGLFGSAIARAAAPGPAAANPRQLPGIEIELKTQDGWRLKAKYLPAKTGKQTYILLHGAGYRKEFWWLMARSLSRAGCGMLALDLRGHGESQVGPDGKPASWRKFKVTKT